MAPWGSVRARLRRSGGRGRSITPGSWASATTTSAPLYGYGLAERRLGRMLQQRDPRDVHDLDQGRPVALPLAEVVDRSGVDRDWQALGSVDGVVDEIGRGPRRLLLRRPGLPAVYDYSYDGVMRSVDAQPPTAGPRPARHPLDPRSRQPLGAGHRRRLPGPRQAARAGRRAAHRCGHEPGRDARPVRARRRLRRLHVRRSLHAPRPGRAGRAVPGLRTRRASRSSSPEP